MKPFTVIFKLGDIEYKLTISAYSKYNAKTRLYKMHPSAEIIKVEEEKHNAENVHF